MPDLPARLQSALAGRYQLERELGRGGMATVWLAQDLRYGRRVALKVLHPELASSIGGERFLREIAIAASLTHPHILPLHESGEADGLLYYVMPYVDGESLRERLRREIQLPVEEAVRITREVADALAYAHGRGIVHRDIKPENILLEAGHAVVADFGVARAIETAGGEHLTATGMAVGTPAYMSPEQAGGSDRVDGRSDIYSLGCVLYEMLAGEPPFSAPTPQAMAAKHLNAAPPKVRITRATVPAEVERVIERAMAKVPADRFATASELSLQLGHRETPPATLPAKVGTLKAAGVVKTHRTWLQGLIAIGVAAVVAGYATLHRNAPGPEPNPQRVVVFPLRVSPSLANGDGEAVATYIGYALEGSRPLQWLEGWDLLSEAQREHPGELGQGAAQELARRVGAKYYISGSVVELPDSYAVVLRLRDVEGDSLVQRAGATGERIRERLPHLGLTAVAELLPHLVGQSFQLDLSLLSARAPAAVAAFLQGEQAYRRMRFEEALEHYHNALALDSALVLAAIKGAQAAQWQELDDVARTLNTIALARVGSLPPRFAVFSRGLGFYLGGDADSALRHFDMAVSMEQTWAEAWMARGEVYYHLLPSSESPDSAAIASMRVAADLDSSFAPAQLHLAEFDLRSGDTARAAALVKGLRNVSPGHPLLDQIELMLSCFRPHASHKWNEAAAQRPVAVLRAARRLSPGAGKRCAKAALAALLASSTSTDQHWGALLSLFALLAGEGDYKAVATLLASPSSERLGGELLHLVLPDSSEAVDSAADALIRRLGVRYETMDSPFLWAIGQWAVKKKDRKVIASLAKALRSRADSSERRLDVLLARVFEAHDALLSGDTAVASRRFFALRPSGTVSDVEWQPWESLGLERLTLARIYAARGDNVRAIATASQLDTWQPVVYPVYSRASLRLRITSGHALKQDAAVRQWEARLASLQESRPR